METGAKKDANGRVVGLFDTIIAEGEEIRNTCRKLYFAGNKKNIPPERFEAWKTNCLSLLKSTFGSSSPYYDSFAKLKFFDYYNSTQIYLGILKGAREDLQKGYFFHKDLMLSVNIYYSLITRALQCIGREESRKAAAILETALLEILAKICENRNIAYLPLDGIEELAKRLASVGLLQPPMRRSIAEKGRLFAESFASDAGGEELEQAGKWLQEFLNEYLGSQIMILN